MKKEVVLNNIGYVYMITSPSNKIYVGSTVNIDRRWKRYKRLDCKYQTKPYYKTAGGFKWKYKINIINKINNSEVTV